MKKRLYLIGTCIGYYDFFFGNLATEKINRLCSFLQSNQYRSKHVYGVNASSGSRWDFIVIDDTSKKWMNVVIIWPDHMFTPWKLFFNQLF